MNINSTTNLTKIKFDTSQALVNKNDKIKEKCVPDEITIIPWEDMDYEKCIGKDGNEFEVVSYYKIKEEVLNKDYLDVFSSKAQGEDVKCYDYYVKNFIAEITKNLSDSSSLNDDVQSLENGINDLVKELKKNTLEGVSNNIENLKTEFSVNGVNFTLKELMDSSKVMEYVKFTIPNIKSGLDYDNYAEMGIAKGKVNTYAEKNLNTDQQRLLNSTMSARIQKIINSVPEKIDENYKKSIVVDVDNKFYGIKNVQTATNIEYAKNIMNVFENVDYSSKESFEKATQVYRDLIKPVLESAGIKNMGRNQALTDTINYEVNRLKSLFDENCKSVILSIDRVKKVLGNSKKIIDVWR